MLKLKRSREYTIFHEEEIDGNIEKFSFTFRFELLEDRNYSSISKMLLNKSQKDLKDLSKSSEDEVMDKLGIEANLKFKLERECLISWSGDIIDEEGNPILVHDENGNIIEENQKIVYEFIRNTPDLYDKVLEAGSGVRIKN